MLVRPRGSLRGFPRPLWEVGLRVRSSALGPGHGRAEGALALLPACTSSVLRRVRICLSGFVPLCAEACRADHFSAGISGHQPLVFNPLQAAEQLAQMARGRCGQPCPPCSLLMLRGPWVGLPLPRLSHHTAQCDQQLARQRPLGGLPALGLCPGVYPAPDSRHSGF